MYEMHGKVRYSEVDRDGVLTRAALLNYFQDCSVAQSESLGVGVKYLADHHIAWMLASWQIILKEMPRLGDAVIVQTWPYDFKGLYGYRNFTLKNSDGSKTYAYANSIWALVDTLTGRPQRVQESMVEKYGLEPGIPMEYVERKITVPKEYERKDPFKVQKYFIDTNGHMNNEKYVMIAEEFLPKDFHIGEIRVEYKKAAMYEDVIYPHVTQKEGQLIVNLAQEEGKPYAIVNFIERGTQ